MAPGSMARPSGWGMGCPRRDNGKCVYCSLYMCRLKIMALHRSYYARSLQRDHYLTYSWSAPLGSPARARYGASLVSSWEVRLLPSLYGSSNQYGAMWILLRRLFTTLRPFSVCSSGAPHGSPAGARHGVFLGSSAEMRLLCALHL